MILVYDDYIFIFDKTNWICEYFGMCGEGHYLSATAQMSASSHNETLKAKMNALVSALKECQDAMKTGYLSAFPSEFFDRFEAIQPVWAPYYTINKVDNFFLFFLFDDSLDT